MFRIYSGLLFIFVFLFLVLFAEETSGFAVAFEENNKGAIVIVDNEIDTIIESYYQEIRDNSQQADLELKMKDEIDILSLNENEISIEQYNTEVEPSQKYIRHKVEKNESLWIISQKYGVPVYTIVSANSGINSSNIHKGDEIIVPVQKGLMYKINKGDTLGAISRKYKISTGSIVEFNKLFDKKIVVGKTIFLPEAQPVALNNSENALFFEWPVKGKLTSRFGYRRHPVLKKRLFHAGLDIGAVSGASVKCTMDGVVIFSGDAGTYGNMVIVKHKKNYMSIYAHLSAINVEKGALIKSGSTLGRVGETGLATGNHLHFEIKKSNKSINPLTLLRTQK